MVDKKSYPQHNFTSPKPERNINKWVETTKELYSLLQTQPYNQAFNIVTASWDDNEKFDFKNWLGFYQQEADKKYKIAQFNPIPISALKAEVPDLNKKDEQLDVEKVIKSIISRLAAAERLATLNLDVRSQLEKRLAVGLGPWLEALHGLKRQIQTLKTQRAASIAEDLIIKEANILNYKGYKNASLMLKKMAQQMVEPPPAQPVSPEEEEENALDALIEGMNFDTNDIQDIEDDPMSKIKILAQQQPVESAPPIKPVNQSIDVVVPEEPPEEETVADTKLHKKTDDLLEAALDNITIHDVIARLEALANLFRTREIPRQLAIIDLMMDKLNISAFFPSLAEANSKSLESNQYALTRVEEILSKLRGTIKTPKEKELDLAGQDQKFDNSTIKKQIEQKINEDKERKELRKQREQEVEDELLQQKVQQEPQIQQEPKVQPAVPANIPAQ